MNKPSTANCEKFHTVNWEILQFCMVLLMKVDFFLNEIKLQVTIQHRISKGPSSNYDEGISGGEILNYIADF